MPGGNFAAQADAALVGGIHAQQNGNACKEHKLLQPAGQAQLPIIAEHRMAAIEQDAFEDGRRIAQAAGPEYHKQSSQNAERAQHPQCVTQFAAAAVQQYAD